MMIDVSIDIETLGTETDAPVLSIGCVLFNIETGEKGEKLYLQISPKLACMYGKADADTMNWWNQQAPDARAEAFGGKLLPPRAAQELRKWFEAYTSPRHVRVWGNGATFDIGILTEWLRRVNPIREKGRAVYPWMYWHIMDMRTLLFLAELRLPKERGTGHHKALVDADFQADWMIQAYATLKGIQQNNAAAPQWDSAQITYD